MNFSDSLYYSKEHAWLKLDDEFGVIGITEFAQSEIPAAGQSFKQDEIFGPIEAIKTVSDLFMPVSGEVVEKKYCPFKRQ